MNDIERYILSNGARLMDVQLTGNDVVNASTMFVGADFHHAAWPSMAPSGVLYFQARRRNEPNRIFRARVFHDPEAPEIITDGLNPSVSPDGSLLTFYRPPDQIWIRNILSRQESMIATGAAIIKPAVWIGSSRIMFNSEDGQLSLADIPSGEVTRSRHSRLIPGAASSNGAMVLCGSYDGSAIYLYFPDCDEVKRVKHSSVLSLGASFVWAEGDGGFLYSRQTWWDVLRLRESKSLFRYDLDGNEIKLLDDVSLFGGALRSAASANEI